MVFEKIKELLANQLDADESLMSMETNIASDLGADSLDVVELLSEIEDEFDIEIPDEDIETIKTIGDLVEYIQCLNFKVKQQLSLYWFAAVYFYSI